MNNVTCTEQSNMNRQSQILAFDSRPDVNQEKVFDWSPSGVDPTDSADAALSHCETLTKELEELDAEGYLLRGFLFS